MVAGSAVGSVVVDLVVDPSVLENSASLKNSAAIHTGGGFFWVAKDRCACFKRDFTCGIAVIFSALSLLSQTESVLRTTSGWDD